MPLASPSESVLGLLLAGTVGLLWGSAEIAFGQEASLPPGKGAEVVLKRCTLCHAISDLPRRDRAVWEETVDKMIRFGAPVLPSERELLIQYLVDHFGVPIQR